MTNYLAMLLKPYVPVLLHYLVPPRNFAFLPSERKDSQGNAKSKKIKVKICKKMPLI